jgi:hypothetical protein
MLSRRSFLSAAAVLTAPRWIGQALAARSYDDPDEMYAALKAQPGTLLELSGGQIKVVFADGAPGLDKPRTLRWIGEAARAISAYFGRYPTRTYGLLVVTEPGARVGPATTYGYGGPATRIRVGVDTNEAFARDWVLVHEMVHTALPDLPRAAEWLQEGSATWIEPIARAQAGELPVPEVWSEAIEGMPQGMRTPDAGGMDGTHEWGRLYWGGAIFWLEAEIAVYEQSRGRFLLRDCLRAINRSSGGNAARWSPEEMMRIGDGVTGTSALRSLHRQFASHGVEGSLSALFARLGVERSATGEVRFNPKAELADLTRRITLP